MGHGAEKWQEGPNRCAEICAPRGPSASGASREATSSSILRVGRAVAAALICVASGPVFGEDLAEVYALARNNDPKYNAARHEFEALTYAEPQARAALLPTASYEYTSTNTDQRILGSNNPVFATGNTRFGTIGQTLTLTQPIFRLSSWLGYRQAQVKVKQAAANLSAAEQDLMIRTAIAYLNVLAARDARAFAGAERDAIKQQLDLVQQRFSSGLVAIANLHDARARHAVKEADVVAAQYDFEDKQQALREVTGTTINVVKQLTEKMRLDKPDPVDINHWVETALRQNLQLEARRLGVEIARQEVDRLRAGHLPAFDLVATNNRKNTGGSLFGGGSNVQTSDVMVRLNVPIFSGGLTSALTGEALSRSYVSGDELERDIRQVERQTRAAFQGVTSGIVRVDALAQGVLSSESARQLKVEGLRSGLDTLLQVLDAERDLYAAKRDFAKSRYDFLLNRLRLKQAVGTLSEADLSAVNELLN